MDKLRQGQTVYNINHGLCFNPSAAFMSKWFLYSRKQELPPEGEIIYKLPVNYANAMANSGVKFYTSRRKAETELKAIKCQRLTT